LATRHQVRNSVISLLFAYDFDSGDVHSYKDDFFEEKKIRNKQKEFANQLLSGVIDHIIEIDQILREKITGNWNLEKLGKVEKSILRLGVYEIIFEKTEKAIIINEALEIIKEFGEDGASKLINGVLDSL
jgi:N utilization substance protein B